MDHWIYLLKYACLPSRNLNTNFFCARDCQNSNQCILTFIYNFQNFIIAPNNFIQSAT